MNRKLGVALITCALCACDGSAGGGGAGSLAVSASGEAGAQVGYPVGEGDDEVAFVDGWTLEFTKVVVSVGSFRVRTVDGDDAQVDADPVVFDLHQGEAKLWTFADVPAQRWDRIGYEYTIPDAEVRVVGDVAGEDVEQMIDEGYSLLVGGVASKGGDDVEFEYGFPIEVEMDHCHSGFDDTDGVVIGDGAAAEAQLTVHLDHLFFDDYSIEDPVLRFDPMAAMASPEGPLTLDDLAAQDNLTDLLAADGSPLELGYDPGSELEPVPANLRDFVIAAATTTGHFNGEGHCDYQRTR